MKFYPAIDLLAGRAVRLEAGQRERMTVFSDRPVELVAELTQGGADRLHIVDLDGAFAGCPQQTSVIRSLIEAAPIPVHVGGGIRDRAAIESVLELGANFVVLGTAAVRSPALVEEVCRLYPGRIIVAVDARDGVVAVDGWTAGGGITAIELGRRADGWGAGALLYTDVARDGLHVGPNIDATVALQSAVSCEVIASGGVGSLDDLAALRDAGIASVIVGRALYDRRFDVQQAVRVAHGTDIGL